MIHTSCTIHNYNSLVRELPPTHIKLCHSLINMTVTIIFTAASFYIMRIYYTD